MKSITVGITGQQGDRSNARKLLHWLQHWYENHSGKKKLTKPSECNMHRNLIAAIYRFPLHYVEFHFYFIFFCHQGPWSTNDDGAYFKAALLSGPPGIGKWCYALIVIRWRWLFHCLTIQKTKQTREDQFNFMMNRLPPNRLKTAEIHLRLEMNYEYDLIKGILSS